MILVSHAIPAAAISPATTSSGRGPTFVTRRELICAPTTMAAVCGRNARPAVSGLYPRTICMYSDRKNHIENIAAPSRKITRLAPVSDGDRSSDSDISGARASRASIRTNVPSRATATASVAIVPGEVHERFAVSTIP